MKFRRSWQNNVGFTIMILPTIYPLIYLIQQSICKVSIMSKAGKEPEQVSLLPQRQRHLLVIQIDSKFSSLNSQIQSINGQLSDTKDVLRKYRQKSIPCLNVNPEQVWINNPTAVYTLNSGGFFSQIPINKLSLYFQGRISHLTSSKKKIEKEMRDLVDSAAKQMKEKKLSLEDVSKQLRQKVIQYLEELEDLE